MASIIDLKTRQAVRKLSPLATMLMDLVEACTELLQLRPGDPELQKIRASLEAFDKEINRHD